MRKRTKRILTAALLLLGLGIGLFAYSFFTALHRFRVEDRIHACYTPVALALMAYQETSDGPASALQDLIPEFVKELPKSPLADSVDYRVFENGEEWELAIHSTTLRKPRVYSCRSNGEYTAEEQSKIVLRYHGLWCVLEE